ncbi:type I restriction endonuclease [uncultured Rhodospira sp.]|uniref:type I restriction endonuclease n=1 Tax=uncultured Rhodospira sp. TaxID=1936189 RepID=UPI002602B235|nr:type I restriction endonuclease [uncultured Rhodospira sp.]
MSELFDELKKLSQRIDSIGSNLKTEEATKNALVMPFVQSLGYNVFDPTVVVPEYTSDHGIKKGEKVDYAIMSDGLVQILIECKTFGTNLDNVGASQLFRYFSVTDAKIAILTNGAEYRFFTDLDETNKMDEKPFFIFTLSDLQQGYIEELEKYKSGCFMIDDILSSANDLKYRALVSKAILAELECPSEDFVRFFAKRVYPGNFTNQVKEWFSSIVAESVRATTREMVNKRLSSALEVNATVDRAPKQLDEEADVLAESSEDGIVTTQEEIEAFEIVRAILREIVPVERIYMRDQKSYCGILLDNNNRKPICRLYFNSKSRWYIGLFDSEKQEKVEVDKVDRLFDFADRLRAGVAKYDTV